MKERRPLGRYAVRVLLALLFGAHICASARAQSAKPTNVELIIDDSGSMAQKVEGGKKIDVAKQVLSGLIEDLPKDAQVAVRTYGRQHRSKDRDCSDMELLVPFGSNDSTRLLPGVDRLKPNGMTPIAASLQAAAKDFAGKEGQNNIIILLTDGEEDCSGDPCAVSKALHDAGIRLQINVIGFHVGADARNQLKCISDASGGKYYDAANAKQLKVAATEVTESIESKPAKKQGEPLYGETIRGGDAYEKAVVLPTGKLFHLDHVQPKQAYDFFAVAVGSGQTIKVSIAAGPSNGSIGAIIASPKREKLNDVDIDGPRRNAELLHDVADQQDGTYYIMIGDPYYPQKLDDTFRVDLIDNYDANSGRDAGETEARAVEIRAGTYPHNYMSDADTMDVFKFKLDAGKTYSLRARPADPKATLQIQVVDSDGTELAQQSAPNPGAAAKVDGIRLAKSGAIYAKLSYYHYGTKGHYAFAFGEGDIESPPPPPQ